MTTYQTKRLAEIRSKLLMFSLETDTSSWEAAFFLKLLEEKDREIRRLRREINADQSI